MIDHWKRYFDYNPSTGELLWKIRSGKRSKIGSPAGYKTKKGYISVSANGVKDLAHRVAWMVHKGEIPAGFEIDHINHVRWDNRFENLRLVTKKDNCKNKSKMKNNLSGVSGVHYHKRDDCWVASIGVDGTLVHLGNFKDKDSAINARKAAEIEYGFHENCGL